MNNFSRSKSAISTGIFGAAVVVLIVIAGIGYGLYGTASGKTTTSTQIVTTTNVSTEMMVTTEMMTGTGSMSSMSGNMTGSEALMFTPSSGAMISSAWLLALPTGMMHEYALSIHAEGLEPNGTYLIEGALTAGVMAMVPISSQSMGMNTTSASEFQANKNGTGNYWIVINTNPATTFENIQLLFLPNMSMQNMTAVATLHFAMMMNSTETSMMTSMTSTTHT